ncbi:MAG: outer membrane beta-barrel protein [Prevotella sp.]|nr:outer membrane beta-barrel protein [Prevotella sp.]
MNKFVFLMLCLIVGGLSTAKAQDSYDVSDVVMGVKAGASFNHFANASSSNSIFIGPMIGADVEIYVTKNFIVSAELSMMKKGAKNMSFDRISYIDPNGDEQFVKDYARGPYDYKLWYISSSYLAKYILNDHFRVLGGISAGRLFRAKVYDEHRDRVRNIRTNLNRGAVGLTVGGEYMYKNKYSVEARYTWDINCMDRTKRAELIMGHAHNSTLSLTFGYRFQLF